MKAKLAFAFAAATTAVSLYAVPSWHGFATDPCLWASAASATTILLLLVTRHLQDHARLFEMRWLALFLAGMPLISLARWILNAAPYAANRIPACRRAEERTRGLPTLLSPQAVLLQFEIHSRYRSAFGDGSRTQRSRLVRGNACTAAEPVRACLRR